MPKIKLDPTQKYIFLDIDGTINSSRDFFEASYYDAEDNVKNGGEIINRGCLAYLEKIIDDTDARIVLSTNWRRSFSVDHIYDVMVKNGFRKPRSVICDETPQYRMTSRRGYEISEFVKEHNLEKFVILDDIDEGLEHHFVRYDNKLYEDQPDANFIRVDYRTGLNSRDTAIAIDILGQNQAADERDEQRQKDLSLLINCI